MLQTKAYARTVMSAVRMQQSASQIDRALELRILRQEVLTREDPLKLWLILDEAVILRTVGGAEVMRSQLIHLLEASELPNVTLQVHLLRLSNQRGEPAGCPLLVSQHHVAVDGQRDGDAGV
jgi:hypothetical protein